MRERSRFQPLLQGAFACFVHSLGCCVFPFFFRWNNSHTNPKEQVEFHCADKWRNFHAKIHNRMVSDWLVGLRYIAFLLLGLRVVQIQSIAMQTGPRLIPPFQITSRYNKAREQMEKKGQKPREQNGPGGMGEAKGGNTKKMSKKGKKKKKESRACTTKPIIWNCRDTKRCLFGFFV